MHDCRKRIDRFAVHEQVQFHQFRRPVTGNLVIHRAVAARNAFNLIIEIDENFIERQFAMQHHPARVERLGAFHLAALLQNQLQDVADVFIRTQHVGLYDRFPNFPDHARIGQVRGVIDQQFFSTRG